MKIAVLGPEYSYSHIVGLKLYSGEELVLCEPLEQVFREVVAGAVTKGIVPIENLKVSHIPESVDGLLEHDVRINAAYEMPIHHCLAAQGEEYKEIISKKEALKQCSRFLVGRKIGYRTSTSKAMEDAAKDPYFAAIGSREAAHHYGLNILQENIGNDPHNATRFLVISLEETIARENARTTLLLQPHEDKPGALFHLLAPFAVQGINLAKIDSFSSPSGQKIGEYIFYLEIHGGVEEPRVKSALDFLRNCATVRLLGSYDLRELK